MHLPIFEMPKPMIHSKGHPSLSFDRQRYTFQPSTYSRQFWGYVMESPVLSFNADGELVEKLDQLALATDQDRQYHLQRALARYVETESWYLRAIQEGIADADAGRLIDLETVKAKWIARANNGTD